MKRNFTIVPTLFLFFNAAFYRKFSACNGRVVQISAAQSLFVLPNLAVENIKIVQTRRI
jgi:hypothetical protein